MLANRYGSFDASGRTFTINDPHTPTPWTNVICNGRYGFVVSQNGGGFSWLDNSVLNVLTRWDMDLTRDSCGRFLYLADREDGSIWSLAPSPCQPKYDDYRCEHTQGLTRFTTEFNGIRARWTLAVAPDDNAELWLLEITNLQGRSRKLRISSFFEWCCGVAPDVKREFHRLFFTTRRDEARKAIIATKNFWDIPARSEADHVNRPWPYVAGHAVGGITFERDLALADKGAFLGRYGQSHAPAAMTGENAFHPDITAFGRFGDAAAALGGDFTLAPDASVTLHYTLAVEDSEKALLRTLDLYSATSAARAAIDAAVTRWQKALAPTHIRTGAPDLDLLCNSWLPYQAISARIWGRTGYYQQSGAYGFRDQLQDSQCWLTLDPARCREQLLLHAAHQFANGSVFHWWHPLSETGNRSQCSDDYLWLPFIAASYIKETGDVSLMDEVVRYFDDPKGESILEHCKRSIARSFSRFSPRGLPLIGSCDWNDGLSAVGVKEKGESVWLAFFLVAILQDMAEILRLRGDATTASTYLARRESLIKAINELAWDGEWYRGCTLDAGGWLGSKDNDEGKIFLNCQTWAALTDAGPPDRILQAWQSAKKHLLSPWGSLLLAPAYTTPREDIGYITRYSPGSRENGGVYMHAATWALAAACRLRDVGAVGQIWKSISPPTRGADAEAYRAEPYVTPGNVDGPLSDTPGKAGWTWYTGSAAWLRKVAHDWMLGARATWEGLAIDPCPPAFLGKVEFTRAWRGRTVRIRFDASQFRSEFPPVVHVAGKPLARPVLTESECPKGQTIEVEVTWPVASQSLEPAALAAPAKV
jgi:cellobiose phosphorylase